MSGEIERAEYRPSPTATGFAAPNRAHNLRTTFAASAIEIEPRTAAGDPAWRWRWETRRFGRASGLVAVPPAAPTAEGSRVCYVRPGFVEWYENTREGLEQGFTIAERPAGAGPLRIEGGLGGTPLAAQRVDDATVRFVGENGASVLEYGKLAVKDDAGRDVKAELVLAGAGLAIMIDDADATYPLHVDPLMTAPAWVAEANYPDAWFGFSVATAGDVNGDGYSDILVGAQQYDNGQSDEGRAYLFCGSASGLEAYPDWTAEPNQADAWFGHSVATAGDVNGDGFSDVIVGASGYSNGEQYEGRVYVYHGSAAGLVATPSWTAEPNQASAVFGRSVATAGDVNGDGYADVIVGATSYDNGESNEGRAFVYHGSVAGLAATPSWTAEPNQASAQLGFSVATAGDVNGDGYADVIVGAIYYDNGETNEGRAFVYHGSAAGLAGSAAWTGEGNQVGASFGYSVATAGDVNGDGYADVIIGAPDRDNGELGEGQAFVYRGSSAGLAATPAWTAESNQASAQFGHSVATAGDVNGDGFSDVIVGAVLYDNGESNEGSSFAYWGSAVGLATSPAWTAESNQIDAQFGQSVATAGDVNGDGFSDVIVGAHLYDGGGTNEGRAYAYHGSAAGLAASSAWTAESNQASGGFGYAVATAGDVNGDGFSDVIVSAINYDNGETDEGRAYAYHGSAAGLTSTPAWMAESNHVGAKFGFSVSSAGDVNGDGYSDVIIGAPYHTSGRVYAYYGSATGLAATPAWTATESNQGSADLGYSVSSAGDVNGDGYSDVIIGARRRDTGEIDEGQAYVYHGSATGLAPSFAWTAEGNGFNAYFGCSVSTAGDVNGDGFSDVVVGALQHSNGETEEGRAYVYHGSAGGLAANPAWTAEANQPNAHFGCAVATAGDVNADGYSDVIVGAEAFTNVELIEGRAVVYHGSPGGLGAVPLWTGECNQVGARFGWSVATAGDVNGDGYSDVIVGAKWYSNIEETEGRAFVYHGSSLTVASTPAWTAESNQFNAWFGYAVATAGDVNGDGYSDVIVGAANYANGQSSEGRVYLFFGNEGDCLHRIARMARADGTAPIYLLGSSDSQTSFRLRARGFTAGGRTKVRLQWEVKPAGVPFTGTGLGNGSWLDSGTAGVALNELVSGLTPGSLYHWRLRTVSRLPFFPWSPWLSLPYNSPTEADVRTRGSSAAIDEIDSPPALALFEPVVPNPIGAAATLRYHLLVAGRVRLAVYDALGRLVAIVVNDELQGAGTHSVQWNGRVEGRALPAGTYFAQLRVGTKAVTQKLVIAR